MPYRTTGSPGGAKRAPGTARSADCRFIPETLIQDDDPLDALVLVEDPTLPGRHVAARPDAVWSMAGWEPGFRIVCMPPKGTKAPTERCRLGGPPLRYAEARP